MKNQFKKIVLAYSGGLDTSVIIHWLKQKYNAEIIAVCGDVGQGITDLEGIREKALATGASKAYVVDLKEELVNDYVFPMLKAQATYENYLLGTAIARPVVAKKLVEIAMKEGADAIAHGCTGKGNDQVRFELGIKAFAPHIQVIAPWRVWDIKGREDAIDYATKHKIPLKITKETNYSLDKNLWHLSTQGMDLEDIANGAQLDKPGFLGMGKSPMSAADKPVDVTISFEKGIPTKINGKAMNPVELISKLNEIGGEHGIGIVDIVENHLIGMKTRGVYETPGGTILYFAHKLLESVCLDRDTQHYKTGVSQRMGELIYNGLWFTPLREALSAFVDKTQENVTGEVGVTLYKGNVFSKGIKSPYSLYNYEFATYEGGGVFDHGDAKGFIACYGVPIVVRSLMNKKTSGNKIIEKWQLEGDIIRD